jgi:hypothetical protein
VIGCVEPLDPEAVGYSSYDTERLDWIRDDEQEERWAAWVTAVFAGLEGFGTDERELRWALRRLWQGGASVDEAWRLLYAANRERDQDLHRHANRLDHPWYSPKRYRRYRR